MSKIDELKKIKSLLDEGAINQTEFETLKGGILAGVMSNQKDSSSSNINDISTSNSSGIDGSSNQYHHEESNKQFLGAKGLKRALLIVGTVTLIWGGITLGLNFQQNIKSEGIGEGIKHCSKDNVFKIAGGIVGGLIGTTIGPEGTLAGAGIGASIGSMLDKTTKPGN
jgi:hypothetical protein